MTDININFNKGIRAMKPLHGINNGSVLRRVALDTSVLYSKLNPPYARFHDTHYPESKEVDIHTIYLGFTKDDDNLESYEFNLTDAYLESIKGINKQMDLILLNIKQLSEKYVNLKYQNTLLFSLLYNYSLI